MDPKELQELQAAYQSIYEAKAESSEKEEEDRKEDDDLAGSPNAKKNGKKKAKRWWDDDGDGKGYEKGEVKEDMEKGYVVTNADKKANTKAWQGYEAGVKKKDGTPLYTAADHVKEGVVKKEVKALQKAGNTLSPKAAAKADDQAGVASRKGLPEETLVERQKDTPLQVAAVIDKDRAKKATDDATYDRLHGKNKKADEDERYSKWERYKMKRDAQRAGHPWEHAKGSTTEKEGKKSEKAKRVYDPEHNKEETLWDVVAEALTELHEVGGVRFKVIPFDANEEKNWIQGAVKRPGAFTKKAKAAGMSVQQFAKHVDDNKEKYSTRTERQANLAQTFAKMRKEGADFDALSEFLINEGADDASVNHVLANWVLTKEDYWMEFEEGLLVKAAKGAEAVGGAVKKGVDAFNKADEKVTKATMNRVVKPVARAAGRAVVGGVKGAVKGALNREGYQRNPEAGEAKERADAKKREAIPGQARRGMPPRGDKKREEFERWYAANVR